MFCPECGFDAGEAKFCPECGNDLAAFRQTPHGRPRAPVQQAPARAQQSRAARRAAERREPPAPATRGLSPIWLWLGVAVVVVVIVAIVVASGRQSVDGTAGSGSEAIVADTSGSYAELVARGNDLYDQGITAFNKNDAAIGEQYFKAASEVYRAAWKKQPGDPNLGTDLAVSLFYMRHHDEGLKQIDVVIKKDPDFQPAYLNKGIFLQTEASEARDAGDDEKGADFLAQAKTALEAAVKIDATSDTGRRAAELLKSL